MSAKKLIRNSTAEFLIFISRVNSLRATQFRQWATGVLREFAVKGYVLKNQHKRRIHNQVRTCTNSCTCDWFAV